jgi:hypothetical protein
VVGLGTAYAVWEWVIWTNTMMKRKNPDDPTFNWKKGY